MNHTRQLLDIACPGQLFTSPTPDQIEAATKAVHGGAGVLHSFQPAVLRMIHQTVRAAKSAGIEVALCGELAGDPLATPVLVGMGLDELSMNATAIPDIKQAIARLTLPEAEAIRQYLTDRLKSP